MLIIETWKWLIFPVFFPDLMALLKALYLKLTEQGLNVCFQTNSLYYLVWVSCHFFFCPVCHSQGQQVLKI